MTDFLEKYYVIVPINHLLKNKEFAKSGQIVKGSKFIDLVDSLKGGYCVEATPEQLEEAGIEISKDDSDVIDEKYLKSLNKGQLKEFIEKNGFEVPDGSKNDLIDFVLTEMLSED